MENPEDVQHTGEEIEAFSDEKRAAWLGLQRCKLKADLSADYLEMARKRFLEIEEREMEDESAKASG